jgi:biotin carboxyl carrier protein
MAELTPTPRDVRVRLAPSSTGPDDQPMRVTPARPPLRMSRPHAGIGVFGGVAFDDPSPDEEAAVLAQRQLLVDGEPARAELHDLGRGRHRLHEPGGSTLLILEPPGPPVAGVTTREVLVDGFRLLVETEDEHIASLRERATRGRSAAAHAGPLHVKAIIPGKVVAVSVAAGDAVSAGQQLLVVEAMKMQNELRAPRDGTIERVGVAVGVNIEIGDLLVVIS